jgi:hypothetical protein
MLLACSSAALGQTVNDGIMLLSRMERRPAHLLQHGLPIFVVDEQFLDKTVGDEVESSLAKCKVLVVERSGGPVAGMFFSEERYRQAVRSLLERGGTLFLDYSTNMSSPELIGFLKSINVTNPGYAAKDTLRSYQPVLTEKGAALIGKASNELDGEALQEYGAYGAWADPPDGITTLARMNEAPGAASLLMQDGGVGQGRVIFCQLTKVWLKHGRASDYAFQENLISFLVGRNIRKNAPGQSLVVSDTYRHEELPANSLYLSRTKTVSWWNEAYERRIPFLVAEPIGKARQAAPIAVPVNSDMVGARVVTYYGEEVACQEVTTSAGQNQLLFLTDLKPREHKVFFLYFSAKTGGLSSQSVSSSGFERGLSVTEQGDSISLRNDAVVVRLPKRDAGLSSLRLVRGGAANAVASWAGIDSGRAMTPLAKVKEWLPAEVLASGPVAARVRHRAASKPVEVVTTIIAGDNPFVTMTMTTPDEDLAVTSAWSPGGRSDDLDVVYPSKDAVKRISSRVQTGMDYGFQLDGLAPYMSEDWLALQGRNRETIGVCFDGGRLTQFKVDRNLFKGITTETKLSRSLRLIESDGTDTVFSADSRVGSTTNPPPVRQSAGSTSFRVILDSGGWERIREGYIAYANPPVVQLGNVEVPGDVDVTTPVPHRDHCRIVYLREKYMSPSLKLADADAARIKAQRLVTHARKWGANVLRLRMSGAADRTSIAFWKEIRRLCNKSGVAIFGPFLPEQPLTKAERASFDEDERPCPVQYREEYYLRTWRDASRSTARQGGCNEVHILDEYRFINMTDAAKALFRERHGGELPPAFPGKPDDPVYAKSLLYRMNVITELNRDLVEVIRKSLSDTTVTSVVNLKGLERLWRISDMEEHSRYLDMPGVDLYAAEDYYRKILMFARGAFNNRTSVENCIGYSDEQGVRRQLRLSTVYGASMLNFGGADTLLISPQKMEDVVGPHFVWMQMAGVSDLLSRMQPIRYAALLRDRNFFVQSIRNMELPNDMKATTLERGLYALADLHNFQTEMIFSRFFEPDALKDYRILMVPDNKYLSEPFAKVIQAFVEQGNCVYIEGEACNANSTMQTLCRGGRLVAKIADADLFATSVGEGTVLYTGAFLSERVAGSLQARAALSELLKEHAGKPALELTPASDGNIDHVVYSDGSRYLVAAVNKDVFGSQKVRLTSHIPLEQSTQWLDLRTGAVGSFNGAMEFELPPDSASFLLIAPQAAIPKQSASPADQTPADQTPAGYGSKPKMSFLRQAVPAADTPERRRNNSHPAIGVYVPADRIRAIPCSRRSDYFAFGRLSCESIHQ